LNDVKGEGFAGYKMTRVQDEICVEDAVQLDS